MSKKYSDLAKTLVPVVKLLDNEEPASKQIIDALQGSHADFDPESFSPNRTANNTEQMVDTLAKMTDLLNQMLEASAKESKMQSKRFKTEVFLSIASILVALVASIASVWSLYLVLANV